MSAKQVGAKTLTRPLRGTSTLLIIAIIAALLLGISGPVTAQEPNVTGSLQLTSQTAWVAEGQAFDIQVTPTTTAPIDQVELVLTVFGAVRTRSQFQQSLDDRMPGSSIILERRPLSELMQADGTARISLPIQDQTQRRFFLRTSGIFPLRVELRSTESGDVLDRFVTHILNQSAPATSQLGVTTVLPVQSPQSLDRNQPFVVSDQGNSVSIVSEALKNHSSFPIALLPQPESISRLQREENDPTKAVVQTLAATHSNRPVLRTTFTPLSSPAYEKELTRELDHQFIAGERILNQTFPNVLNTVWAATDTLGPDGLAALKRRGVDRIIVREQDLSSAQRSTTLARPFTLSNGRGKESFEAAQADKALADHFADAGGPVLGAHHLLADLAVLWNDAPALERNVVIMPPRNWTPNPQFLELMLRGIETSPVVKATTVQELFTTPIQGGTRNPLIQRLAPVSKVESDGYPTSEYNQQRDRLEALASIAEPENKQIIDLHQQLLLTQRADLDVRGHKEWLSTVKSHIDRHLNGIHLPEERSIRLTARQGEIPVTVQNDNGYPVRVKVRLLANKLDFPNGNERVIDASRQYSTERFAVEARTSGAFGVQVQLESPDGSVVLQESEITVRSTATSTVGLSLSIGAIAFLALWWIRSIVKSRRKMKAKAAQA